VLCVSFPTIRRLDCMTDDRIGWWEDVFPVRCIWLGSLFLFIGGGATVFAAMIFAIVADVFSEEKRSVLSQLLHNKSKLLINL
jgi:hypothetical protein